MAKLVAQAIVPVAFWSRRGDALGDALRDSHRFSRAKKAPDYFASGGAKNGDCPRRHRRPFAWGLSVLLGLLLLLAACGDTLPSENTKPLVTIVGAKLIDGAGSQPIEDSVIVIEDTRIRAAGPRSHTPVPKGSEIVNGAGKVVIPGLVDAHVHYFGDRAEMKRELRAQLYFGVTTVRSLGADTDEHLAVVADRKAGKIPGPRIYTAGRGFLHPEGFPPSDPRPRRPATPEQAREQVRELAAEKVDFIKIWVDSRYGASPKITPEVRAAIVEEADKHHIPVVAHVFEEEDVYQLGELGVNDFLHFVRDKEPLDEKFIEFAKGHDISFVPTLTVLERWYFAENPAALEDQDIRLGMNPAALAGIEKPETQKQILENPDLQKWKEEFARAQHFVKQISEAGVTLVLGSDSGAGTIPAGWGTHHELTLMVEAGLSPLDVLRIATHGGARRVSRGDGGPSGGEPEFGTIEAGKIADMVLLDADPLDDIANTAKINRVMQAGKWLDRQALSQNATNSR